MRSTNRSSGSFEGRRSQSCRLRARKLFSSDNSCQRDQKDDGEDREPDAERDASADVRPVHGPRGSPAGSADPERGAYHSKQWQSAVPPPRATNPKQTHSRHDQEEAEKCPPLTTAFHPFWSSPQVVTIRRCHVSEIAGRNEADGNASQPQDRPQLRPRRRDPRRAWTGSRERVYKCLVQRRLEVARGSGAVPGAGARR